MGAVDNRVGRVTCPEESLLPVVTLLDLLIPLVTEKIHLHENDDERTITAMTLRLNVDGTVNEIANAIVATTMTAVLVALAPLALPLPTPILVTVPLGTTVTTDHTAPPPVRNAIALAVAALPHLRHLGHSRALSLPRLPILHPPANPPLI